MMREEYDFSKGVRGAHAARYAAGVELVVDGAAPVAMVTLDPDVANAFPNAQSVNEALRLLINAAKNAQELAKAG
jgi:CO dehydrogenase/acetyl-CoA synthase gamma subunit (corrinoid Fe-S protein)